MSLLMEALRKAEEAKAKGAKESDKDLDIDSKKDGSTETEPMEQIGLAPEETVPVSQEPRDLQTEFGAALSVGPGEPDTSPELHLSLDIEPQTESSEETADSGSANPPEESDWKDLDLHPMQVEREAPEESAVSLAGTTDDFSSSTPGGGNAQITEPSLEPISEPYRETSDESSRRTIIDDYAVDTEETMEDPIDDEAAAWKSRAKKINNPRDYKKIALLVVVLSIVTASLFWYLGLETAPTPATAPVSGFLGGPDPLELVAAEENADAIGSSEEAQISEADLVTTVGSETELAGTVVRNITGVDRDLSPSPDSGRIQNQLPTSSIQQREVFSFTPSSRSSDLVSLQMEANSAARAGLSAHAREQYQWLLTAEPNNSDALLGLARLDSTEGNIESARASYIRLLELDPTDPIAQAGLLNLGADDALGQEAELKYLVSRYPNAAPLPFVLGNLLASQQRWKEAEASYAGALNTAKTADASFVSPDYAFNLAVALEKLNKPNEAYLYYQEALQLSRQISPGFDVSLLNSRIGYLQGRL